MPYTTYIEEEENNSGVKNDLKHAKNK